MSIWTITGKDGNERKIEYKDSRKVDGGDT